MPDAVVLTLVDGTRIAVPDSLFLITPYVLREQQDFFEDELPFVRLFLQPGQHVIDVGANLGVYTLPMAQKVGPTGHVWAFEPASTTARFLARSIAENCFAHVTLQQTALSSVSGSGQLAFHSHAELRSIIHGVAPPGGGEDISLTTLDDCMDRFRWKEIELIKIDAEGEEANIIQGGRRFFENLAPLVQYELKTHTELNVDLVLEFAALGYDSYRLVPGLNVLVPFDPKCSPDPYLLNLFCCKAERANRLAARGLLIRSADLAAFDRADGVNASQNELPAKYHWRHALANLAYAAPLVPEWELNEHETNDAGVTLALSCYVRSHDGALPMVERFRALESSFLQLRASWEREPLQLRLASLARVANDLGERALAVNALTRLVESITQTGVMDTGEPFLAPMERFDRIAPGESLGNWVLAAVLEQLERRERFSSFYAGARGLIRLETIQALGFANAEMERRLELVRLCIAQAREATVAQSTQHDP